MTFPIAFRVDIVIALEQSRAFAEDRVDLGFGPDIEFAFFVVAVCVEAAGEPALGVSISRPTQSVVSSMRADRAGSWSLANQGQQVDQLGIVVEHLLEMGHEPSCIGGVTRETATKWS